MPSCLNTYFFGPDIPTMLSRDLSSPVVRLSGPGHAGQSKPLDAHPPRARASQYDSKHVVSPHTAAPRTIITVAPLCFGERREFRNSLQKINTQLTGILSALSSRPTQNINRTYIARLINDLTTSLKKIHKFHKQSAYTGLGILTKKVWASLLLMDESQIGTLSRNIEEIHKKAKFSDPVCQLLRLNSAFTCLESTLQQNCFYQVRHKLSELIIALSSDTGQGINFFYVGAMKNRLDKALTQAATPELAVIPDPAATPEQDEQHLNKQLQVEQHNSDILAKTQANKRRWQNRAEQRKSDILRKTAYLYLSEQSAARLDLISHGFDQISRGLDQKQGYDEVLAEDPIIQTISSVQKRTRIMRLFSVPGKTLNNAKSR